MVNERPGTQIESIPVVEVTPSGMGPEGFRCAIEEAVTLRSMRV
jgi:hypothetical protein